MTATSTRPTPVPTPSPLRLEPPAAFATLRSFLREAQFDEDELCRRLDIASIDRFRAVRDGRPDMPPADALDALVRLFLDNEPMRWSDVEALVPPPALHAMRVLGLLRDHRTGPTRAVGNVLLYPADGLHIVSDAATVPDGDDARWWDLVYAAITTNTRRFLATMPRDGCDTFLDLCAGTGIAALVAGSRFARHAWAIDVADRSTHFARFNALLNDVANVTAVTGDLYQPVAGLTFDRIVAHPPYVPARETQFVYRDGGSDGEEVTRRIIQGLPDFLRPGGSFHCTCTATDRRGAPLEQRLRGMLGPSADEFDIAVLVASEPDPTEYYVRLAIGGRGTWREAEEWHHHFAGLGVERMVYGTIAIVRHERPHAPYTVRRREGSATGADELRRLVRAAEESASTGSLERLLASRPLVPDHVSLRSQHQRDEHGWVLSACQLSTDVPFDVRLPCPPAMVPLLGRMDGSQTVRAIYEELSSNGALADDASIERFASYVHALAAHGLVVLRDAAVA